MDIKEVLEPSAKKVVALAILVAIEFFILPVLGAEVYSPKEGYEMVPMQTFCTVFQSFIDDGALGTCYLYYGSYIYIICVMVISYAAVCVFFEMYFDKDMIKKK
jgi:hypothetical protein